MLGCEGDQLITGKCLECLKDLSEYFTRVESGCQSLFCRDFIVMSSAEPANFPGHLSSLVSGLVCHKSIIELHK